MAHSAVAWLQGPWQAHLGPEPVALLQVPGGRDKQPLFSPGSQRLVGKVWACTRHDSLWEPNSVTVGS